MKALGIITEYNPFHLGHKHHIEASKRKTGLDYTVVVMSGNCVQRGDFALIDKFERAKEAILNGGDLVLELPIVYSSGSAEIFGKGSIEILNGLGIIDTICFGSESNDLEGIKKLAKLLAFEGDSFKESIKYYIQKGYNFPKARELALKDTIRDTDILKSSNDILGVEYIKNMYRINSRIRPECIQRKSAGYHDLDIEKAMPSATAIRKLMKNNELLEIEKYLYQSTTQTMSETLLKEYKNQNLMSLEKFFLELKLIIIREGSGIARYFEVNEGIENLIEKAALQSTTLEELIEKIKSKRYTYTRIRRMLMNILLGITKEDMKNILESKGQPVARVLAFNDKGREMLKEIGKNTDLNKTLIITKAADYTPKTNIELLIREYDNRGNSIYYSKHRKLQKGKHIVSDIALSPIYVRNSLEE